MNRKPLSRSVQARQIKKLRPKHYEILVRMLQGQTLRAISREMRINESWASIVTNSPVFQEEFERRLQIQEQAVIEKLAHQRDRELDALARAMRYGEGEIPGKAVGERLRQLRQRAAVADEIEEHDPNLGDRMVRALGREKKTGDLFEISLR